MSTSNRPRPEEVDQLLRNAELRDELEPYLDESVQSINTAEMPTPVENQLLESMLAWERAPVVRISQWFEPELVLPSPTSLNDEQLHQVLWETIHKLYEKQIVLDFTDHLSDRQLYRLIYCNILPSAEKKVDLPGNVLHWDCAGVSDDPDVWLRYYASEDERNDWSEATHQPPPPRMPLPFPRRLPQRLL